MTCREDKVLRQTSTIMQRRLSSWTVAIAPRKVLLVLASVAAWSAPSAWAGCTVESMDIPVRIVHSRPVATLVLNGTEVPMLVDSGAFFSMLAPSTAEQLQLRQRNLPFEMRIDGYTGAIDARAARVARVGLRNSEIKDVDFVVGGTELGAGIMGVLGRNILSIADTEYDLAHGVIRLAAPNKECKDSNLAYWANGAPVIQVPMERRRNNRDTAIRVPVAINGKSAVALMDTGAPETVLTLSTAKRAGISKESLKVAGFASGAGEGKVKAYLGMVDLFEIGGEKIAHNTLRIDDNDTFSDGLLLGLDYFLAHRVYVSRLQGQVYATWNGSPIFARQKGREASEYDQRYAARPDEVEADNADALARRGNAFAANRDPARALEDLGRAIDLAPTVPAYRLDRARVLLALKRGDEALLDLDEALRLDPALAEARVTRASLRVAGRKPALALEDLTVLDTQLAPSAPQRLRMAEFYRRLGRLPDAIRQWSLWLPTHESDHDYAAALNGRCRARTRLAVDLKLAVEDCKAAVSQDKTVADFRESLGWAYLRSGEADRARNAFDAALEMDGKRSWSLYGRGMAFLQLKDAAASQRDLQAARALNANMDAAVRAAGLDVAPDAPAPAPASVRNPAAGVAPVPPVEGETGQGPGSGVERASE